MSPGPVARLLLALLTGYQRFVSPLLGPRCRFSPTCSAYAARAVATHGAARGSWLAVRRLARCHPFHPGGHDPVPPARTAPSSRTAAPSATMEPGPRARTAPLVRSSAATARPHRPARPARPGPGS